MVHPYQCFVVNFMMYLKCITSKFINLLRLQIRGRLGTNSKPPRRTIMIGQSETWTSCWIILITVDHIHYTLLRQALVGLRCALYQPHSKLCKNAGPKAFCWVRPASFDFLSSDFKFGGSQSHRLSSCGVAPIKSSITRIIHWSLID